MICFGIAVLAYVVAGAIICFEAFRRGWNEQLNHYDQTGNLGWFVFWWWFGSMILARNIGSWYTRFSFWFEDVTDSVFERISEGWRDETDS